MLVINEPANDQTYNKRCGTSEDSDQPAHPRSLIRVFADRMRILQPSWSPKTDKREPLPFWVDVQANLNLCWSHRLYCRFLSCAGSNVSAQQIHNVGTAANQRFL